MNICSCCSRKNRIHIIESFLNSDLVPHSKPSDAKFRFKFLLQWSQKLLVITIYLYLPICTTLRMKHHVHAMFNKTHSVRFILVSSCNNDDAQICNGKNWMKDSNAQIQLCNKQGVLQYNIMFFILSLTLIFEEHKHLIAMF